jgi:hypothetical protein
VASWPPLTEQQRAELARIFAKPADSVTQGRYRVHDMNRSNRSAGVTPGMSRAASSMFDQQ